MDQILHPLTTGAYYADPESHDQLGPQATHPAYRDGSIPEQLRREEALSQAHPGTYSVAENHGPHYLSERSPAVETQFTSGSTNFAVGDSSGSISSSANTPGSAVSSLAQPFNPPYQINYSSQYFPPTGFGPRSVADPGHSYGGWRADSNLIHPGSPSTNSRDHYTYQNVSSSLVSSQVAHANGGIAYPGSPRSVELGQPYTPATSVTGFDEMPSGSVQEQSHLFPFLEVEHQRSIQTASGDQVRPAIHAMATKGFFTAQGHWTCYRRNYFGLSVWYDVGQMPQHSLLFVDGKQIQSFAMHLTATIEGQEGKEIELVQYTPKRDLGEKTEIATTKVGPSMPIGHPSLGPGYADMSPFAFPGVMNTGYPYLPLQNEPDEPSGNLSSTSQTSSNSRGTRYSQPNGQGPVDPTKHSFDRVQFKGATQNNGKRRASQQFYILIVELFADVRDTGAKSPDWKRVAVRPSDKLVVRGRSPSHYKDSDNKLNNNNNNNHTDRGGHQGGYSGHGQHGSPGGAHGGASAYNPNSGNPGAFRPSYNYQGHSSLSPTSNYSATSPSSDSDTVTDIKHQMEPNLGRDELAHMQGYETYRYYPETLYDGVSVMAKIEPESPVPMTVPGVGSHEKPDSKIAIAEEYPSAAMGRHWGSGAYTAYMGTDSSRGWYPGLHVGLY